MLSENQVLIALYATNSANPYTIDFDDVWQSLGYSTKGNAKARLFSQGVENEDYILSWEQVMNIHNLLP